MEVIFWGSVLCYGNQSHGILTLVMKIVRIYRIISIFYLNEFLFLTPQDFGSCRETKLIFWSFFNQNSVDRNSKKKIVTF